MKLGVLAALLSASATVAAGQTHVVEGIPGSKVKVVIYEDLACSDCAIFSKMLDEKILPVYGGEVTFLHKDFPLAKHPWARKAAIAGRFFLATNSSLAVEYRRAVMREREQIRPDSFDGWLRRFAQEHGADPAPALASLNDPKLAAAVEDDYEEGVARGIAHTPTVFVNGRPFIETIPYKEFAGAIDRELARR